MLNLNNEEIQLLIDFLSCPHASDAWGQLPDEEKEKLTKAADKLAAENSLRLCGS